IVTFTLDLLKMRGETIDQVVIVYLASSPRYMQAHRLLTGEFAGDRYDGETCHLRSVPIRLRDEGLSDARTPQEVDAVWKTFYQLFSDLKSQGQRIHLSQTGGRRIMALLAFSVAMLHFDSADRAWHLHTPDEVVQQVYEGAMMHVPPEAGVQLIEVPLVPWGTYFPGVRSLLGLSPQDVRTAHLGWLDETERARCRRVWDGITPRQRDALQALVNCSTREEAADQISIEVSTIDSHKTEIIRACRLAWDTEVRLDIHFLRQKFRPFLAGIGEVRHG
ncbi:MAG: histidine kinase, partial [Chloroflexi bacterium]|nr:histidine kinase [Chloroflexota bacterium]